MPRNSSGTMSLPSPGVPFQSGQTISSAQVNATLTDLATEVGSSLDRSGRGGALAPIRGVDGTAAAPSISFTAEPASGIYRAGPTDVRVTVGGVDALKLVSGGIGANLVFPVGANPIIQATAANAAISLVGNRSAADTGTDTSITGSATRTAGDLLQIQNGGSLANGGLGVDYHGLLRLGAPATAIQPGSIVTTITPDAGHTAASGLAYWKDAGGMVHIRGVVISGSTVTGSLNLVTTNPLPAGFRPNANRHYGISVNGNPGIATVSPTGTIGFLGAVTAGNSIWLDSIHFLAEA